MANRSQARDSLFVNQSSATEPGDAVHQLISSPKWLETYLPHISDIQYVYPRVKLSQGRNNVSIVIGIPTIERPSNDSYILDTLQSFFDGMDDQDRKDTVIVVSISEPWKISFESAVVDLIKNRFSRELEEGSLEVIAPHPQFYPDLDKLKLSLGDPKIRVKWRSKQNMDYGFIMMHSMGKASYYLQMEDDISTVKGFVASMKKTIAKEKNKPWISLSFSQLGYIGRLYRTTDVRGIMQYLLKNFDKKPCDWLQYDYLATVVCTPGLKKETCRKEINKYTWLITPTIFQHKGFRSSFQGRVNKLQDKFFPNSSKVQVYPNPKAVSLLTSLEPHKGHTLQAAYNSKGFFWGKTPRKGDTIEFLYDPPISISRIDIVSGQRHHSMDIITSAILEILPATQPTSYSSLLELSTAPFTETGLEASLAIHKQRLKSLPMLNATDSTDRFYILGHFSVKGDVKVQVAPDVGKIRIIRIRFESDLNHWVLLDQILIL